MTSLHLQFQKCVHYKNPVTRIAHMHLSYNCTTNIKSFHAPKIRHAWCSITQ